MTSGIIRQVAQDRNPEPTGGGRLASGAEPYPVDRVQFCRVGRGSAAGGAGPTVVRTENPWASRSEVGPVRPTLLGSPGLLLTAGL